MKDLELVDLKLPKEGFREFISSWIFSHNDKIFVVDPGPTNSLNILCEALGDREPEFILLTHIHVDHAGGVGALCKKFPKAKIVAHEKAHRHLIDPTKLIEGSTKTLGDLMDLYGPIEVVREEQLCEDFTEVRDCKIIPTPGHAPHHMSFIFDEYIFCGEALGVRYPLSGGIYYRPASPPVFDMSSYLESIDRLKEFYKGQKFCFGHFGVDESGDELFKIAREQILLWKEVLSENEEGGNMNVLIEKLIARDKRFRCFNELSKDIKERERLFLRNSIAGLL